VSLQKNTPKPSRAALVRVAQDKPQLRAKLVPYLRKNAADRTASLARDMVFSVIDRRGLLDIQRDIRKAGDEQSAKLITDIQAALVDLLNFTSSEEAAVHRLADLVNRGKNWDAALIRNNIFKVANGLGIKLPSGMFASERGASSPEQWEMAARLLDEGWKAFPLKKLQERWDGVGEGLESAQKASKNLRSRGVGRTEDGTLIVARIVPALRDLARDADKLADKLEKQFR